MMRMPINTSRGNIEKTGKFKLGIRTTPKMIYNDISLTHWGWVAEPRDGNRIAGPKTCFRTMYTKLFIKIAV